MMVLVLLFFFLVRSGGSQSPVYSVGQVALDALFVFFLGPLALDALFIFFRQVALAILLISLARRLLMP